MSARFVTLPYGRGSALADHASEPAGAKKAPNQAVTVLVSRPGDVAFSGKPLPHGRGSHRSRERQRAVAPVVTNLAVTVLGDGVQAVSARAHLALRSHHVENTMKRIWATERHSASGRVKDE